MTGFLSGTIKSSAAEKAIDQLGLVSSWSTGA